MPITTKVATVKAPFNEGALGLFNALNTWLAANRNATILDVDNFRPESTYPADEQRIRILYEEEGVLSTGWQARFYRTNNTSVGNTAAQQFGQDSYNGITFVPWFVLDVTDHEKGRSTADTFILLGVNTTTDTSGFMGRNIYIGEPAAPVLAGASGLMNLFDGSGSLVGQATVSNLSDNIWYDGERNYVVQDEETGVFVGLAPCSVGGSATPWTPPALTTSTPYPCPTYYDLPQAQTQTLPPGSTSTSTTSTTTTSTTTTSTTTTSSTTSSTSSTTTTSTTTTSTSTTTSTTTTAAPAPCTDCSGSQPNAQLTSPSSSSLPFFLYSSGPTCSWIFQNASWNITIMYNQGTGVWYMDFTQIGVCANWSGNKTITGLSCVGGHLTGSVTASYTGAQTTCGSPYNIAVTFGP